MNVYHLLPLTNFSGGPREGGCIGGGGGLQIREVVRARDPNEVDL